MARIVIGLSGGVDSSVAAYLLKEQGHDVVGFFMINWHDTEGTLSGACPWEEDRLIAEMVARKLDIGFYVVDLSEQYRQRVVDYMFSEYEKGRTPNPDVLCNREIKFDVFVEEAKRLGLNMSPRATTAARRARQTRRALFAIACLQVATRTRTRVTSSANSRRSNYRWHFSPLATC